MTENPSPNASKSPDEKTGGLYRLITNSFFYERFQRALGAKTAKSRFADEWLVSDSSSRILDVGCGTANILEHLTFHSYVGIDHNREHIEFARGKYSGNVSFVVGSLPQDMKQIDGRYDQIICTGFLHHLNDQAVSELLVALRGFLQPDGFIAVREPVFLPKQRLIAKLLKNLDSGQHIRTLPAYRQLFGNAGFTVEDKVSHDLSKLPYDHYWARLSIKN